MDSPMKRQPEPELMDLPEEAEAYAQSDFSEVNAAFVERLLNLAGELQQAAVVDLGTGPADIPIRVATQRPRWQITAVDASQAMLELARQAIEHDGLSGSIRLVLADAKATKLPDDSFDIVMSNSILHHLSEVGLFWKEAKRIARPGALVLMRDLARPPQPRSCQTSGERLRRCRIRATARGILPLGAVFLYHQRRSHSAGTGRPAFAISSDVLRSPSRCLRTTQLSTLISR